MHRDAHGAGATAFRTDAFAEAALATGGAAAFTTREGQAVKRERIDLQVVQDTHLRRRPVEIAGSEEARDA